MISLRFQATVLLAANVSFLAIQSIDEGHGENRRSVAQISSYASTLLSLANYVTCQVLLRQHRSVVNGQAVSHLRLPLALLAYVCLCLDFRTTILSTKRIRSMEQSLWLLLSAFRKDSSFGGMLIVSFSSTLALITSPFSMITFLHAVCWLFFWQTDAITRGLLGALLGFLLTLISLLVFLDWQPTGRDRKARQRPDLQLWDGLKALWHDIWSKWRRA